MVILANIYMVQKNNYVLRKTKLFVVIKSILVKSKLDDRHGKHNTNYFDTPALKSTNVLVEK